MALTNAQIIANVRLNLQQATTGWAKFTQMGQQAMAKIATASTNANNSMKAWGKGVEDQGRKIRAAGLALTVNLSAPFAALAKNMSANASQVQEMQNRYKLLFGEMSNSARAWSEDAAVRMNKSALQLQNTQQVFMNFFKQIKPATQSGIKAAMELSNQFTELTQDISSFHDVSEEEALTALKAGLAGEIEPLRKYGIMLSEVAVNQKALAMGFEKTNGVFTESAKVAARVELILGKIGVVSGDATRTAHQFANEVRGLGGAWFDFTSAIGENMNKILQPIITFASQTLRWLATLPEWIQTAIAAFILLAAVIGPVIMALGAIVMSWGLMVGGAGAFMALMVALTPVLVVLTATIYAVKAAFGSWIGLLSAVANAQARVVYGMWLIGLASDDNLAAAIENARRLQVEADRVAEENKKAATEAAKAGKNMKTAYDGSNDAALKLNETTGTLTKSLADMNRAPPTQIVGKIDDANTKTSGWLQTIGEVIAGLGQIDGTSVAVNLIVKTTKETTTKAARGGFIRGPGGIDNVPAWLTSGEFVHRTAAVRKYGLRFMHMVNSLMLPRSVALGFASGGLVPGVRSMSFADSSGSGGGMRPFNLVIGGQTFENLRAPQSVAEELMRMSRTSQVRSTGRAPPWMK